MNLRDIATTLTNLFSAAAGPETQVATSILSPSINVLAKAIATHGVSVVIDAAEAAARRCGSSQGVRSEWIRCWKSSIERGREQCHRCFCPVR